MGLSDTTLLKNHLVWNIGLEKLKEWHNFVFSENRIYSKKIKDKYDVCDMFEKKGSKLNVMF